MNDETQVIFAADARKQLFVGMKVAADAVACTLGPAGRTVLIQQKGRSPVVTKDGATVAKSVRLHDPVQRMGAELVLEAANQTNDTAGDGTTTATVLTYAMVEAGLKLVAAGHSAIKLCRGIEATTALVVDELRAAAKSVQTNAEIAQIGTISANGDGLIGDLIAQAMERVGRDGIITVDDAKGTTTSMDVTEGMQFDRGYISPYFVTDPERMRATYDGACVLVTDKKLSAFKDIQGVLERVVRLQRPLLIIADDFEGDAMTGLVLNRVKGNLAVVAIKAPGYGLHRQELLQDICVLTGATLVSAATGLGLDKVTDAQLGHCKRLTVDARTTTLVGTGQTKAAIDQHVDELRSQLQDVTLAADDVTKLKVRAARLSAGVAVIRVGGATEIEMQERKFRIEDALNATKAAADEGIVPGGGMALFNAVADVRAQLQASGRQADPDEWAGASVVLSACLAPILKIVSNTGESPSVVIHELERKNSMARELSAGDRRCGYNAATGTYCDMIAAGIIDPVKVTRTALKNAASVAVTFLSLDAVVYDEPTKETPHAND